MLTYLSGTATVGETRFTIVEEYENLGKGKERSLEVSIIARKSRRSSGVRSHQRQHVQQFRDRNVLLAHQTKYVGASPPGWPAIVIENAVTVCRSVI